MKRNQVYQVFLAFIVVFGAGNAVQSQDLEDPQALWGQATLYRDEWGVPHVFGDNPRALAFGFGYAQAEDHLKSMLLAYRMANGRAAELLGESQAQSDAFSIKMGHAPAARTALDQADELTVNLCEGFALGANAWLLDHPGAAPEWAEGVHPADVLALWHALLTSMAPMDMAGIFRTPRAFDTGNAWAVSPKRTVEGRSLLVINAHQYYDGPFQWYEAHLVCGDLNVAGATLFGLPVILQGHNEVMGWGLTPNDPDSADMFVEDLGESRKNAKFINKEGYDPTQNAILMYMSKAQPYYVRTENGLEERTVPAMVNSRGPVFENGNGLYSWRIGGYGAFGGLAQLWEMGRSRTLSSFQDALKLQQIPCFHIVYVDQEGHLFYQYNAQCGIRQAPNGISEELRARGEALNWKTPVSTEFEYYGWRKCIDPEDMPWITDPAVGYIQACGNPPWLATDDPSLRAESWPAWLFTDPDSYRARRVRQLLSTGQRSVGDMYAMLYDMVAGAAVDLSPKLLQISDARKAWVESAHPDLPAALDSLRGWNGIAEPSSTAMTFYHAWWSMLQSRTLKTLGNDADRYAFLQSGSAESQDLALESAADAVRMMRNEFQNINVPWGDVHRIVRGGREEPIGGSVSGDPLFIMSDTDFRDGRWYVEYGYGFAMAVQFGDGPDAYSIVPFGASEDPQSPHYNDQWPLLREKRLKHTRFAQEDVWRFAQWARGRNVSLRPMGVEGTFTFHSTYAIEVRLSSSTDAPAALPPGLIPYTLYVRPEWAPASALVDTEIEMFVPDVLCDPEDLVRLSIHTYIQDKGWFSLAEQEVDSAQRVFSGAYQGGAVYAVLGPEECLIPPAPPSVPTDIPGSDGPEAGGGKGIFGAGMPGQPPTAAPPPPANPQAPGGQSAPPAAAVDPAPASSPQTPPIPAAPQERAAPLVPAQPDAAAPLVPAQPDAAAPLVPAKPDAAAPTPEKKSAPSKKTHKEKPQRASAKQNFGPRR